MQDAATQTGISRSTIDRLRKDPEFIKKLSEERKRLYVDNCAYMQSNMRIAIDELMNIIQNRKISAHARIKAIELVLNFSTKSNEEIKEYQSENKNMLDDLFC